MEYPKSIITDNPWCYVCGNPNVEIHHIFNKSDRAKSTKYGLVVPLCPSCHRGSEGAHGANGSSLNIALKKIGQKKFEEIYSHDLFMEEFGRNYL